MRKAGAEAAILAKAARSSRLLLTQIMRSENREPTPGDALGAEYEKLYPRLKRFAERLETLVRGLIIDRRIELHAIEARPKKVQSFLLKARTQKAHYPDPIRDIPDLVGLRIIVLLRSETRLVARLIEEQFAVDWDRSERKADEKAVDQFSYLSDHYVVKLGPDRASLEEWKEFVGLHAEIQVRTVLQHAWAAVSHKLAYKNEREVPESLLRKLNALSAVLEGADESFDALKQSRDDLVAGYLRSFEAGDLGVKLNLTSLAAFLEHSNVVSRWSERALAAGFRDSRPWATDEDGAVTEELRRSLLEGLLNLGIESVRELAEVFQGAEVWGDRKLREIKALSSQAGFIPYANPYEVVYFLVLTAENRPATREQIATPLYRPPLRNALCQAAGLGCFGNLCIASS